MLLNKPVHTAILIIAIILASAAASSLHAGDINRWLNQAVYVPLYSHIYADDRFKDKPFQLTATLSIRNTDPKNGLLLDTVDYFDSHGKKLRSYIDKPVPVGPLASIRFIVPESDKEGGSGAKFLVHWRAEKPVSEPIVESVMIGTKMQQGISFISQGRVIDGTISK
ncbi:MAG: DUF3124 domain-containing protein [Thermodesulfobacteriota bacterium]|nr:DUF3124 domain-containing protein [Thermodesulfobacteriota bacterium]